MRTARGRAVVASIIATLLLVGAAAGVGFASFNAVLAGRTPFEFSAVAVSSPSVTRVPRTPVLAQPVSGNTQGSNTNDDSRVYLAWVDRTLISVDDATLTLLNLVMAPERDSSWSLQVTGVVSVWTSAYHNAMSVQPPLVFARQHAAVVGGFSQYNAAAAVVLQGANEGNDRLVAKGIDQALAGRAAVSRALAAMRPGG